MWTSDQITIEIEEVEDREMIVVIRTPVGSIRLMGEVSIVGGVLMILDAHVHGLSPGDLLRGGLNAIGFKLLEVTGADSLILQGGTRTTGRNAGRAPRCIRFPR